VEIEAFPSAVFIFMKAEQRRCYRNSRRAGVAIERESSCALTWLGRRDLDPKLKEKLMADPDQFFQDRPLLKDGNTCTVVEVLEGGKTYVLKRYNQKSWLYRCLHLFSTPRALLNWSNGFVLQSFGVATPQPLACLLLKSSGVLLRKAYVLMEYVDGQSLSGLDRAKMLAGDPPRIPQQFARLWRRLDSLDTTHGDFKASNFMIDQQGCLILIDLDSLQFHRVQAIKKHRQEKDMSRFMRNWKKDPEVLAALKVAVETGG